MDMGFINITSGRFRGRKLKTPEGFQTRPLLTRVRKSLADILRPVVPGSRVLDLFGGSGAIAFELLSNGADSAVIVEISPSAADLISDNSSRLGVEQSVEVLKADFEAALKTMVRRGQMFDIIIAAPPYSKGLQQRAVDLISGLNILSQDGTVVVQRDKHEPETRPSGILKLVRLKEYGRTVFEFMRRDT